MHHNFKNGNSNNGHPSELNSELLNKIKQIKGDKRNVDVKISLREFDQNCVEALDKSIEQAETGDEVISMTMEDFLAYTPVKGL